MSLLRIMVALAAILASAVLTARPAQAGGWAVTVLDPLPPRLEAGRSYTVGYWVLQHGSHPYEGALGTTGLKLVDDGGRVVTFEGVALREPAHFAAAIAIPTPGRGSSTASRASSPTTRSARSAFPAGYWYCGRRPDDDAQRHPRHPLGRHPPTGRRRHGQRQRPTGEHRRPWRYCGTPTGARRAAGRADPARRSHAADSGGACSHPRAGRRWRCAAARPSLDAAGRTVASKAPPAMSTAPAAPRALPALPVPRPARRSDGGLQAGFGAPHECPGLLGPHDPAAGRTCGCGSLRGWLVSGDPPVMP